jgi:hypothetical protein
MNTSKGCGTTSAAVARVMMSANVAPEERRMTSARMPSTPAERSEVLQPKRPQPSADTNEQLHSTRPFIPTDLVQNTAEYLGRVAGLLSFRGVSTEWQGAVSDAVGFLNGRCWNRLECHTFSRRLIPTNLGHGFGSTMQQSSLAALCCVSDLGSTTLSCVGSASCVPLRLLGETNETLVTLSLHGALPVDDLSCLLGCVALRELSLQGTQVTNESFAGLGPLLARLHKLDLSGCKQLKAISNLAPATSLRELNLAYSGVADLRGLEKLVALETLDVTNIRTDRLVHPAAVPSTGHAVGQRGHHRTRKYHPRCSAFPRRLPPAHRSSGEGSRFAFLIVSASQHRLEVSRLGQRIVARTRGDTVAGAARPISHSVDDVRSLAGCRALKELMLQGSV